jgi:hypothetical protein
MKIAVIKHASIKQDISDLLLDFKAYESVENGIMLDFHGNVITAERTGNDAVWYEMDNHLEWEDFIMQEVAEGKHMMLQGLTAPQEWIREKLPFLQGGSFQLVIFMYQKRPDQHSVTSWARFGTLYPDTDFVEIALPHNWEDNGKKEAMRNLTHEIMHVYVRRMNRRVAYYNTRGGTYRAVTDVMDNTPTATGRKPYYKEFDIYAKDGNRAIQRKFLRAHPLWSEMTDFLPIAHKTMWQAVVSFIKASWDVDVEEKKNASRIKDWADAIQKHEGWYMGSCSYRGNNPANARWANQPTAMGTHKCGAKGAETEYALFPDYKTGRKYLEDLLTSHATGKSTLYTRKAKELFGKNSSSELTIYEHLQIYAPSADSNNPLAYAQFVAQQLGVSIDTQIKTLV